MIKLDYIVSTETGDILIERDSKRIMDDIVDQLVVFCKPFLDKVAKCFWTLLHVQIGQSCNAPASLD